MRTSPQGEPSETSISGFAVGSLAAAVGFERDGDLGVVRPSAGSTMSATPRASGRNVGDAANRVEPLASVHA